jgi:hypothetical protein
MSDELSPQAKQLLTDLWNEVKNKPRVPEPCRATYDHFAHDDCPGTTTPEEYAAKTANIDYDDVAYLEFYHETYIFGDEVYRIEVGEGGIVKIYSGTVNLITHEDGRTQEIPWSCVREWSHVEVD